MINVNELEARWLKYKIKSFIPYIVIFVSILIISAVFVLFNTKSVQKNSLKSTIEVASSKKMELDTKKEIYEANKEEKIVLEQKTAIPKIQPKPVAKESIELQPIIQKKPEVIQHNNMQKNTLAPSLDFMAKLQGDTLPYFDTSSQDRVNQSTTKVTPTHTEVQKIQKKVVTAPIQPIVKKSSIQIDRQNTHDDINQVIKRFKKNNNPALSLFIAKKYYQLGEYHQSYNYSLMTNEIDNDIEASWIIFAKSLVKLNEKSMAVETLNKYISHSNSHRAKILLDNISSGKFK
jgi:hypothetical protein